MRDQSSRPHVGVAGMRPGLSVLYAAVARAVICLALLGVPCRARGQSDAPMQSVHPELRLRVEAPLLAAGATLLVVGKNLSIARRSVPPGGLDPSDIRWSFDRGVIGERSTRADTQSDYFRDAALAYPMALAFASQPSGTRVISTLRRSLLYAEALFVAEGLSKVMKGAIDRPRPFTYLPANQRPNNPAYDVSADHAFQSMPSGHAISTFCSAGFAMADHLISRPDASWKERVGSAFVGGFLAGTTAGLRIEAGQHFPSDTIAGGLIGTATGVAVPLVHYYIGPADRRTALPSGRAWRQAILGETVGIAVGILVAETY
ncbi:MAG: phosphatase PAP2 family protein [Candidatus Eisenbacteria bacterium]|uniref:Phosphatase PAP2 family protein n=1 Tax=Eiseniibacteriota bacterium TaxID=2212470 RepID=A0A538T0D3_UNCEI|nr:MAG: phosphatase PAP2 family protein [Candidatus Eisenbacteria bacterium]